MGDHTAFFYGTLLIPKILHRVIYGTANPEPWQASLTTLTPGLLHNYQRRHVRHAHYPAITPSPGSSVRGTICTGLTEGDMWRLDVFEGDEYEKVTVTASVLREGVGVMEKLPEGRESEFVEREMEVQVYVWKDGVERLEEQEWDFEEFVKNKSKLWTGEEEGSDGEVDSGFEDVRRATDVQRRADGGGGGGGSGNEVGNAGAVNGVKSGE